MTLVALLLASCSSNSSGSATTTGLSTGSSVPSTSSTTGSSSVKGGQSGTGASSIVGDFAKLSGLTNYAFTSSIAGGTAKITISGRIHSPSNYEIDFAGSKLVVVGNQGYDVLGTIVTRQAVSSGRLEETAEDAAASQFAAFTKVAGEKTKAIGPCTVAGEHGTVYSESSPSSGGVVEIHDQGCVSSTGALLSFEQAAGGSAIAADGLPGGASDTFSVLSIGTVPPIPAP